MVSLSCQARREKCKRTFGKCQAVRCYYYFDENGKPADYRKAVAHLSVAAEAGDFFSQYLLAGCYESGYGVKRSLYDAEKWYRRAAKQGFAEAKERLKKLERR